jgi:hypothetical protein
MEVVSTLQCPCRPGFTYKDLRNHQKTKMHMAWESVKDVKDVRIQAKQFENEIERLKRRLAHKEDVETELMCRIRTLEHDVKYWKQANEGVYI